MRTLALAILLLASCAEPASDPDTGPDVPAVSWCESMAECAAVCAAGDDACLSACEAELEAAWCVFSFEDKTGLCPRCVPGWSWDCVFVTPLETEQICDMGSAAECAAARDTCELGYDAFLDMGLAP